MLQKFREEMYEERVSSADGKIPLALIVLDERGRPDLEQIFISTFPWAYSLVLHDRLHDLKNFQKVEQTLKQNILQHLRPDPSHGSPTPLTVQEVLHLTDKLTRSICLPKEDAHQVKPFALRIPQRRNEPPEVDMLNSFFLEDLSTVRKALERENIGLALARYLYGLDPAERRDVVKDRTVLREILAPGRTPKSRWPGRNRPSLSLMQQCAVNHAARELGKSGMASVNGPPGTGKTTMLRDLVAKVVLDRAVVLAAFDHPEAAFRSPKRVPIRERIATIYRVDPALLGFEMVVASSNNQAVENISRQLPLCQEIADDFDPPIRYFASIADRLTVKQEDGMTWGLAAAVLGNKDNRRDFVERFWWEQERGMKHYLQAVGSPKDGADLPAVAVIEQAPKDQNEALTRWHTARANFRNSLERVTNLLHTLELAREALEQKEANRMDVHQTAEAAKKARLIQQQQEEKFAEAERLWKEAAERTAAAADDRKALLALRPNFFARLFSTNAYRHWQQRAEEALAAVSIAREEEKRYKEQRDRAQKEVEQARTQCERAEKERENALRRMQEIEEKIDRGRQLAGDCFADPDFWQQSEKDLERSTPWLGPDIQRARDELFKRAFELHRAFVDAAAKPLHANLGTMMAVLRTKSLHPDLTTLLRHLWASFFLVVPVVSTTFASFGRLFSGLGKEEIGWLFIDEAGQATPQSAVGALWRCRRAVVVGDPMQIEPVVTTPLPLIEALFKQFGVDPGQWAAPWISVQTLADRGSWLGTSLMGEGEPIWVGCPLRVHRRCDEPMFSISNQIAYNGLMVFATPPERPCRTGQVLGETRWIDVKGENIDGKWSPPEGERSAELLLIAVERRLQDGLQPCVPNDIFFITPFRQVAFKLRDHLRAALADCQKRHQIPLFSSEEELNEWFERQIGTIHTFQGKEAEAVILVLGAPGKQSLGARYWAGKSPNLLNVAVTRAKQRLYVIGDFSAWKSIPYFSTLSKSLGGPSH
ncbi:DEAD/DEAH box helicase [Kyrpidia tusciae]|uniref:DEAD/DEAH box helicase n=1 Tax=Kyrpidia tusciae TaxID=33943 RepID=UPI0002DD745D|nr:DEAD/DEAH box helicase [Kyrpidia tusciae]